VKWEGRATGREQGGKRESMEVHEMGKIAPKRNIWHLGRSLGDYRPVAYILSRVSTLTRDIDLAILSVCPSAVRHIPVSDENGLT